MTTIRAKLVSLVAKGYYIVFVSFGLYNMMIWNFRFLLMSHLVSMHVTVSLMVIDTQNTLAVQKHAFPALSRSL